MELICAGSDWGKGLVISQFFRVLGFFRFLDLTYEDRTQNYDPEVHEEHSTHASVCHKTRDMCNVSDGTLNLTQLLLKLLSVTREKDFAEQISFQRGMKEWRSDERWELW